MTNEMEPTDDTIELAEKTMKGDLRKLIIELFKDPRFTGKSWKELKEAEQRSLVADAETVIEEAITRAVDIIASNALPHCKVLLKQVAIKDNIKGVFECDKAHELRHDLADAAGNHVIVVLPDASIYMGQRNKVKFDKDQPELPATAKEQTDGETNQGESFDPKTGEIKAGDEERSADSLQEGDGNTESQGEQSGGSEAEADDEIFEDDDDIDEEEDEDLDDEDDED